MGISFSLCNDSVLVKCSVFFTEYFQRRGKERNINSCEKKTKPSAKKNQHSL